jgi:Methyltransferase domain
MLGQARTRAGNAGVELHLRECDMRDLAVDEPAALIYCPFRALLHLPTWADRRRTFERAAASLRPGGQFAWNAFAFDHCSMGCGAPPTRPEARCSATSGDTR